MPKDQELSFQSFAGAVENLMTTSAESKGYNQTGVDGPNEVFDFITSHVGDGHALGEMIFKVLRYDRKRNPEDLLKVAAWAFLMWRYHLQRLEEDNHGDPTAE